MSVSEEHDVVILGTSPVLLIEGLVRARAGQMVTFVESNPRIGGAWTVAEAMNLRDIEAACHLIVNYRGVYKFLSDFCGLAMEKVEPCPLLYREGKLTPFNARRHVVRRCRDIALRAGAVSMIRAFELLTANRWRLAKTRTFSLRQSLQSLANHRLYRMFDGAEDRAICYPIGGAPAMLKQFVAELTRHGAKFVQTKAVHVSVKSKQQVTVSLSDNSELRAKELVVSESAEIRSIETNSGVQEFSAEAGCYPSLFIRVQHLAERPFSYIELPGDPLFERVTDVTPFCHGTIPKDCRILVFELPKRTPSSPVEVDPETLIGHLQSLHMLPKGVSIAESVVHELTLSRSESALCDCLRGLSNHSVTVVNSHGDFALSIHRNQRRWQQILAQVSPVNKSSSPPSADGTNCEKLSTASLCTTQTGSSI